MNTCKGILVLLALGTTAHAQVLQPGTKLSTSPGTTIITNTTIEVKEGARLDNSGNIIFSNDLYDYSGEPLTGKLIANGNNDQLIGGADMVTISSLTLDGGNTVSLDTRVDIADELVFRNGILSTSAPYPVTFLPSAQNPVETGKGYVDGTAIMQQRPVGTGALNFLGTAISAGTDLGDVSIVRTTGDDAVMTVGEAKSIAAVWDINTTVQQASGHDISFSWVFPFDNELEIKSLSLFGNVSFDSSKFIKLNFDNRYQHPAPLSTDFYARTHTFVRNDIDYVNRTFTLASGLAQVNTVSKNKITTFPNPATDYINILLENFEPWAGLTRVRVTDAYGKAITEDTYNINGNMITVRNLGSLVPGMYRLFVIRGKTIDVVNFIKQ